MNQFSERVKSEQNSQKPDPKKIKTMGAFHYARLTGQRSVGIPEENGTTFSD